jgi:class 3 adenylate cyclase
LRIPQSPFRNPQWVAGKARPEPGRRGERKQGTVLFADVKGSMELAEQLDPEEWSQIMQRFFRILSDGVERFEGFVDKFTGDGIMALFGAPSAHSASPCAWDQLGRGRGRQDRCCPVDP